MIRSSQPKPHPPELPTWEAFDQAYAQGLAAIWAVKKGQLQKPPLRHSSLMGNPVSACLMKLMICSSVYLLFLMSVIFLG